MKPIVSFRRMEDGTREDYLLLDQSERDYAVGLPERVLDTLRELKIDERTFVLFTSDNGGTPRAFYIGVDAGAARMAVCLAPSGLVGCCIERDVDLRRAVTLRNLARHLLESVFPKFWAAA